MPTLTATYPLATLNVGSYFTVYNRFQHARVAASEYGRKHRQAFSCRMQDGEPRSMRVYRVEFDQATVDQRGRNGRRELPDVPASIVAPTREQYCAWLASFAPGQSYAMPIAYYGMFGNMMEWTRSFSELTGDLFTAGLWHDGTLMITFVA